MMNNKIKEFAKQAGIDTEKIGEGAIEAFSTLIILECARVANENTLAVIDRHVGNSIKEHFDIKEKNMLIQTIKKAQLAARKAAQAPERSDDLLSAPLLTTIVGEAEMVGKNAGNRAPTDAEVIQVLKKFEKNMLENEKIYKDRQMPIQLWNVGIEIEIVRQFLPIKLTNLQVEKDIGTVMTEKGLAREQKSLGVVTKELKVKYGDQFDGQQISTIFKGMLA